MYYLSILFFLLSFQQLSSQQSTKIYIAKIDWHVGILLEINDKSVGKIKALKEFEDFEFVDIGWGDAEFYQSEVEFDAFLAAKAILFPTPSVLRIKGYNFKIERLFDWRDFVFELELSESEFDKLCKYIENSFEKDENSKNIITKKSSRGDAKYYSSVLKYHVANTCNTWVAAALQNADQPIDEDDIITADHLLVELLEFAKLIKLKSVE